MTIRDITTAVCIAALSLIAGTVSAYDTLPLRGSVIKASDTNFRYTGRVSQRHPDAAEFTYPGVQIEARFEGTSAKMIAKPKSGYFMVQIDGSEAFKVAFTGEQDSVVTIAAALPRGEHSAVITYAIEGYEFMPEFRGLILDEGCSLRPLPEAPQRKIEFIGNSITCGYGNESINKLDHFDYATENHYYTYAAITARNLNARESVCARSGIGVYRNYDGPKTGNPKDNMRQQYEYTFYNNKEEKWNFDAFVPDVICINLGTNDTSTKNYDKKLLRQAYQDFLKMVRRNNPSAKIVFLTGSMLQGEELEVVKSTLDDVAEEARKDGDKEVYRFDMTPHDESLYYGADYHPSYWQHQKMAAELTAYLRALMHWF